MLYYVEAVDAGYARSSHIDGDLEDGVDVTVQFPDLDEIYDEDDPDDAETLAGILPTHPARIVNWAGIDVNDRDVQLNVSIGDPRGALTMRVWGVLDEETGEVRTRVSVPDEGAMHVPLRWVYGGVYEVVPHGTPRDRRAGISHTEAQEAHEAVGSVIEFAPLDPEDLRLLERAREILATVVSDTDPER